MALSQDFDEMPIDENDPYQVFMKNVIEEDNQELYKVIERLKKIIAAE